MRRAGSIPAWLRGLQMQMGGRSSLTGSQSMGEERGARSEESSEWRSYGLSPRRRYHGVSPISLAGTCWDSGPVWRFIQA